MWYVSDGIPDGGSGRQRSGGQRRRQAAARRARQDGGAGGRARGALPGRRRPPRALGARRARAAAHQGTRYGFMH